MIGEDTKDLGEVWINFARKLGLGENVSKLRVTGSSEVGGYRLAGLC